MHLFDIWTSKKAQIPVFFTLLTWKCASRHNDVQPAALASLLFDSPEPQIIGKTRLFYLFAQLPLLSSLSFSSLIFSLFFFSSLTLPTSAFPSVHIVGSLTPRLPSIIDMCTWAETAQAALETDHWPLATCPRDDCRRFATQKNTWRSKVDRQTNIYMVITNQYEDC